ncbi:hypothetical protein B0H13DRAFT_1928951 [Mycena leptocephala]|nr:hypothetical protein B0H13DRAFT_1928951 [Mycena leptocephala]
MILQGEDGIHRVRPHGHGHGHALGARLEAGYIPIPELIDTTPKANPGAGLAASWVRFGSFSRARHRRRGKARRSAQPGHAPTCNIKVKVKASSNKRGGQDACESDVKTRTVERLKARPRPGFGFRWDLTSDSGGRIVHPRCDGAGRNSGRRAEHGSQVRCEEGVEAVGSSVRDEPWVRAQCSARTRTRSATPESKPKSDPEPRRVATRAGRSAKSEHQRGDAYVRESESRDRRADGRTRGRPKKERMGAVGAREEEVQGRKRGRFLWARDQLVEPALRRGGRRGERGRGALAWPWELLQNERCRRRRDRVRDGSAGRRRKKERTRGEADYEPAPQGLQACGAERRYLCMCPRFHNGAAEQMAGIEGSNSREACDRENPEK